MPITMKSSIRIHPKPTASIKPSLANSIFGTSRPSVAQFAEDTTIHGIKDLFRNWNRNGFLKWTWIFLLIGSTASMIYEMVQVILNYLARPTATQISQMLLSEYTYPKMLFCPRSWINASRVKEIGIPKPTLTYALSFLHLIKVASNPPIFDFKSTETQLKQLMIKYRFASYSDLYLNISDDSALTMTCPSCRVRPLPKRVSENGVCYLIDLEPAKISFLIEQPPQITYTPVEASEADTKIWLPNYNSIHTTEQFHVGYTENDFFGPDPIKLVHNKSYVIKITPTLQKRFSGYQLRTGRGCYDSEKMEKINHSQRMCYSDCEEWAYGPTCWKCQYYGYSYNRTNQQRPPWFSSLTYVEPLSKPKLDECLKREKINYDLCAAKCLPPCEEWIYDTTVVAVNSRRMWIDRKDAAVTIVISYQVKAGTLAVEEISTYTYHTFLSNIGGQLGLWLGASVLSVFQLVFFLIRLAYDRWIDDRHHHGTVASSIGNGHLTSNANGVHPTAQL